MVEPGDHQRCRGVVAHGTALSRRVKAEGIWAELDPNLEPTVAWPRPIPGPRAVVLLGAFDPPTLAHVAVLDAATRFERVPAAICMTKVLLARPPDELLTIEQRLSIVDVVAAARSYGLALANRGTYMDVHRGMRATGIEATFLIGSDKVGQLADPSFYPDGQRGVDATFAEVDFLVVPRGEFDLESNDLRVLPADDVFGDAPLGTISSTEVRRRIREGVAVDGLVPPEVVVDLEGYTAAK